MTVLYTDLYLGRAYRTLQRSLRPDATIFLGDLFDGGREWGTLQSSSPEERYKKYGSKFWLKEYVRFSNLFLRSWNGGGPASSRAEPAGRRILASIPGNHDLGFAAGIQPAVKSRFDAYFGPLNRIDVIGNHSIVSLDSVSLSSMDQVDPETGSSGAGDGSATATASGKIWKPVEAFLVNAKDTRARAIEHTCRTQFNWYNPEGDNLLSPILQDVQPAQPPPPPDIVKRQSPPIQSVHEISSASFPTIVLSHVPFFRSGTTSCGPMRERGTAIPLQAGYQYQTVLTPLISQDIVKHLRQEEVVQIYSGDDHDYCEIEHSEFTGHPKEITVKSMSWAMGIRVPGVQLVSLWNPVDCERVMAGSGPAGDAHTPRDTIQNRLCLLPDQLGIFIRYAQTLGFTLIVLLVFAVRYDPSAAAAAAAAYPAHEKSEPLLPLSHQHNHNHRQHTSSTSSIHNNESATRLSTRKLGGYGQVPLSSRTSSPSKDDEDSGEEWGMPPRNHSSLSRSRSRSRTPPKSRLQYFGQTLWRVVWPVLILYFWLIWRV